MARTEQESDRRRDEKWQTCWCCQDQQRACRMVQASAKKLCSTGPAKKEEWPQHHNESSCLGRQSYLCQTEKEQSRLSKAPGCKVRVKVSKSHTSARERGIKAGAWREKGGLHRG